MRRPDEGSVLDRRTLNRTLLARQHLLRRVEAPVAAEIEHLVGMQAQVPRDPYVGLWSRLRDFDASSMERLLLERSALRMTLMRTTLHLVTARDAGPLRVATQDVCTRAFAASPFRRRLDGIDLEEVTRAGTEIVEEAPRTVAELGHELGERWPGTDGEALAYAVRYLVPLVQVTPRGLLRASSAPRVTTLRAWMAGRPSAAGSGGEGAAPGTGVASSDGSAAAEPSADADGRLGSPSQLPDRAIEQAVERYLRAFGPATAADIRTWSWFTGARAVIERLRLRLRSYRDESGRELIDVQDGTFAEPDEPAPVRFLGEFDNAFLAHADRSRITGDGSWGEAYLRRGAFFVDGFLAGAWRLREPDRRIELEARTRLEAADRDAVETEALGLGRFLAADGSSAEIAWRST